MIIRDDELLFDLKLKPIQNFLLVLMHLILQSDYKYLSLISCRLKNITDSFFRDVFEILRYPEVARDYLYRHRKQLLEVTPRFLKPYNSSDIFHIKTFIQPLKGVKFQDKVLWEFGQIRGKKNYRKWEGFIGYDNNTSRSAMCTKCLFAIEEIDHIIKYNLGSSLKNVHKHWMYSASWMYSEDTKLWPLTWLWLERYEPYTDIDLRINFISTDFISPHYNLELVYALFYILANYDDMIVDKSLWLNYLQKNHEYLIESDVDIRGSYRLILYEMPRLLYSARMKLLDGIRETTLLSISLLQWKSGHERELLIKILRTVYKYCDSLAYRKILLIKFIRLYR